MMAELPVLDIARVRERIARLLDTHPEGAVVFDADGTLWTHDVGCMVFDAAAASSAFKDSSRKRLAAEASRLGQDPTAARSATELVRLIEAGLAERPDFERALAELQVWAYVDFEEDELRNLCRDVLGTSVHSAGLHRDVLDLAAFARARGARTCVVSASPRIVVEEALLGLGFDSAQIIAGEPRWTEGRIDVGLDAPLPYGPQKAIAGRQLLGQTVWLATFGDSGFDLDMMWEAQLAVGIGNKPQLLGRLHQHPDAVLLAPLHFTRI
jgi:phosphoserine phosphatase